MRTLNAKQRFNDMQPADKSRTLGAGVAGVGAAVLGEKQIRSAQTNQHTAKAKRLLRHQKALTANKITPLQFLTLEARDGARPKQIEEELRAWGGKWQGVDFGNSSQFSVVETKQEGWNTPSCFNLKLTPTEGPSKQLGLRGGATVKDLESETVVVGRENQSIEALEHSSLTPSISQWSPTNNLAENQEEHWQAFSVTVPKTPFFQTYAGSFVISFAFVAVGSLLWDRLSILFQRLCYNRLVTKDMDTTKELRVTCESPDSTIRSAKASTALLRVLVAFHDGKITKPVAISLLIDYHSKTVEEALALLEEPQSTIFSVP